MPVDFAVPAGSSIPLCLGVGGNVGSSGSSGSNSDTGCLPRSCCTGCFSDAREVRRRGSSAGFGVATMLDSSAGKGEFVFCETKSGDSAAAGGARVGGVGVGAKNGAGDGAAGDGEMMGDAAAGCIGAAGVGVGAETCDKGEGAGRGAAAGMLKPKSTWPGLLVCAPLSLWFLIAALAFTSSTTSGVGAAGVGAAEEAVSSTDPTMTFDARSGAGVVVALDRDCCLTAIDRLG